MIKLSMFKNWEL